MDSFKIIGETKDYRTNTQVYYSQISIHDYFELIGTNYNKFKLQRKKESYRGYERLKNDLEKGALIPAITLAVDPIIANDLLKKIDSGGDQTTVLRESKDNIYILDGLQRTHKMNELRNSKIEFNPNQRLLLEIWLEPNISNLVYRLIILNSGQKPMSLRHQIELLFNTLNSTLKQDIAGLELLDENDESRRTHSLQFPFERIVTAYRSFLTKSPEINKAEIVSEKLLEEKILDQNEDYLTEGYESFKNYLKKYCELDELLFLKSGAQEFKRFRNWFAEANVINSFFAALGFMHFSSRSDRALNAIDEMISVIRSSDDNSDPLNLSRYGEIKERVADPKVYNVGYATRKLLTDSFKEFFKDEGHSTFEDCIAMESLNFKQKES